MIDTPTPNRLSAQQINKALLFARNTYPNEFQLLVKNVELGAGGVWVPDDEQFLKVFEEWYVGNRDKFGEGFASFVEGKTPTDIPKEGVQSSLPDKETLASWSREAEGLAEVSVARKALIEKRTKLYVEDLKRRASRRLTQPEINGVETKARLAFSKGKRPSGNEFLDPLQQQALETTKDDLSQKMSKDNKAVNASLRESVTREFGGARPDTLFSLYGHVLDKNENASVKQASQDSRLIDGFSSERNEGENTSLFRALAEHNGSTIQEKGLGKFLDSLTNSLGHEERGSVSQNFFSRALKDAAENTQALTDRIGSEAASFISKNLKIQLAAAGDVAPLSGVGKIITEVGYSVFGGQAQGDILSLLELEHGAAGLLRPNGAPLIQSSFRGAQVASGAQTTVLVNGVFVSGKITAVALESSIVYSRLPFQFSIFTTEGGRLVFSALGKSGAGTAVGAAGKIAAGLGIKAGATAAGAAEGAAAGAAAGSVVPGPGTVVGAIIGFIGSSLIVPAWNILKKGAGAFFSGKIIPVVGWGIDSVSSYFGNGLPPPKKDSVWLTIIVIILIAVLLPFGTTLFQTTSYKGSALVSSVGGGNYIPGMAIDCEEFPDDPRCSMEACDPTKQNCMWPTQGYITQGPFARCGNTSHRNSNAIDIGAPAGTDVYATTTGTVGEDFYNGCTDNVHDDCGGGYGNHLTIESNAGYTLLFGHLSQGSILVKPGDTITNPNMVIAEVDDNGHSTGPHLHFELRGSLGINNILPKAVGQCSNRTPGCPECNMTTD